MDSNGWTLVGCLEETRDTLDLLVRMGEQPEHIISITPEEAIRQRVTNYVDLRPIAAAIGVPWTAVQGYSMNNAADEALFRTLKPRLVFVVGWQRLLPETVLRTIKVGAVGFHGSANILPWGRGRSPINWSIIEGRNRFALHMFLLAPGVDDGNVIGIQLYDINLWDTCRSVYYKTAIAQAELIARCLPQFRAGSISGLAQYGDAFHYGKRSPEDGRIDWSTGMETICRLVRGVTWPYPGAFTVCGDRVIRIWHAQPFSRDFFANASPGDVCFASRNRTGEFVVRCIDGSVLVTEFDGEAPNLGARLE